MSQIHFHQDFYATIKNGSKTQTARFNETAPEFGMGEAIFTDMPSIPIKITKVTHKKFTDLSREEIRKDGFETKEELWTILHGFYPLLNPSDKIMLIEFTAV